MFLFLFGMSVKQALPSSDVVCGISLDVVNVISEKQELNTIIGRLK